MYELQPSFSKGVNHLNCFGREISYIRKDYITFLSGACAVIEHLQSGHQRLIAPSQQETNGIIESIMVSSTDCVCFVERNKDNEDNVFIAAFDPISMERKSIFAMKARQQDVYTFASATYLDEMILIGLMVRHQHDNDTLTLSLYKINGEILAEFMMDHNCNGLHSNIRHDFQMNITSIDTSIVCIQSRSQFWFFRYYYCQKSNKWDWKLLNRPTVMTTTTGDKPMLDHEEHLTCHASLRVHDHNITVFATNFKRLIITESGVIQTIQEIEYDISCMESMHDLLLVGTSDHATILVFSMSSMKDDLILQRKIQLTHDVVSTNSCGGIRAIAISPDGTSGCVTIQPNSSESCEVASTIATFHPLEGVELKLRSRFTLEHASKEKVIMSTSIQNDIIASVGRQSLVLLDMQGDEICCRKMEEPPLWVSLHPSGLHILLAFEDEVRCDHILMGEFKTFWRKSGKNTRMCKFSNDGEKFGVIQDGSILVFDFISGELVQDLKHSTHVVNFMWLYDQTYIISHNEDGILYRWNTFTGEKQECVKFKGTSDMKYVATKPDLLWLHRGDLLQELNCNSFQVSKTILQLDTDKYVTLMIPSNEISKFCVIVLEEKLPTSISSYVRIYNILKGDFIQIKLFGRVSGMVISSDDKKLYAFLNSGVFLSFDIVFRDNVSTQEPSKFSSPLRHRGRENLLVSESYLQGKEAITVEYEAMLKEEHNKHAYRMELASLANQEEIARLTEELSEMSSMYISMLDKLQADQQYEQEQCHSDIETQQRLHQNELEQLEANFKLKIEKIKEHWDIKEREGNMQIKEKESIISELKSSQAAEFESLQNELKSELDFWKQNVENIKNEIRELSIENKETLSQTEYEIEKQVEMSKSEWIPQQSKAREDNLKSSSDNALLTKKTNALLKSIDERKDTIRMMLQRQGELEKEKVSLENILKETEMECQSQIQYGNMKSDEIKSLQKKETLLLKQNKLCLEKMEDLKHQSSISTEIENVQMDIEMKKKKVIKIQNDISKIKEDIKSMNQDSIMAHQELKKKRETYSVKSCQFNRILGIVQECLSTDLSSAVEKLDNLLSKDLRFLQNDTVENTTDTTDNDDNVNDNEKEKELLLKELQSLKKRFALEEKQNQEVAKIRLQENQKLLDGISKCRLDLQKMQTIP